MAVDYLPGPDTDLRAWVTNFVTYANANLVNLGLVAGDMTPVTTAQTAFNTALDAHIAAQASAEAARQTKDTNRASLETALRPLVRRLQASSSVDNTERQALGITVKDSQPTPVGPPSTRPVGSVDTSQRLRHMVHFVDETEGGAPGNKAKPAGVMGCEVWVKVTAAGGAPPVSESELSFLALDTRTPYLAEYAGADAGKTAHYWLRWVSSRGEKGPWSETVSATIPG